MVEVEYFTRYLSKREGASALITLILSYLFSAGLEEMSSMRRWLNKKLKRVLDIQALKMGE
jgi:hypothetical protein